MRNSELMRRRANVSMLDLGRSKSDREAIGEISQEEKDDHSYPDCAYRFVFFPPFLEDDLLMRSEPVLYE